MGDTGDDFQIPNHRLNDHSMRRTKGQSSVELLIILAVGMIILAFILTSSQSRLNSSQQALAFSIAKGASQDIALAADAVYTEGVGAKRVIGYTLPEGTIGTSISQNGINIRVMGENGPSDAIATTSANLCPNSNFQSKPGTYAISVESLDGCVLIGAASNLSVSTTLLSFNAFSNSTVIKTITYANLGSAPISVNANLNFTPAEITAVFVNPLDASFPLNPGQTKNVDFKFDLSSSALGTYSGYLNATGSNGDILISNIAIDVSAAQCISQPSQPQCNPTGSNISLIDIKTYSSNSYSQIKEIFDPSENILISGGNFDPSTLLTLDVRDPTDAYSLNGYPKPLTTNSSGGFSDSLPSGGLGNLNGYIVRASGIATGSPTTQTANFNINACT